MPKSKRLSIGAETIEIYAPNSHDAHYFYQTLEAALYLRLVNPECKSVLLHLLPVNFNYRAILKQSSFRAVLRLANRIGHISKGRKIASCNGSTRFRLAWLTVINPNSLYSSVKSRRQTSFDFDSVKFVVINHGFSQLRKSLKFRYAQKQALIKFDEILAENDSNNTRFFSSLTYERVNIGELIISTALSKDQRLAGEFKLTTALKAEIATAVAMVEFSKQFRMHKYSYVTTHEPMYLESIYKRALHGAGASILETFNYKSKYILVRAEEKIPNPWIADNSESTCSNQMYEDFFRKRLFETDNSDLWYMHGNFNQNQSKIILDYKGTPLVITQEEVTILLCLHSFTDAQHAYGFDDFTDYHDFFKTCIDSALLNTNIGNVLVKLHPNVDYSSQGIEKRAFEKIEQQYSINEKVHFLSPTASLVAISEILNLVAVTHHGSVAEELVYLGVPVIASTKSPWSDKYNFVINYTSRNELIAKIRCLRLATIQKPSHDQVNELMRFITEYRFNSFAYKDRLLSERIFVDNGPLGNLAGLDYEQRAQYFESIPLDSEILNRLLTFLDDDLKSRYLDGRVELYK